MRKLSFLIIAVLGSLYGTVAAQTGGPDMQLPTIPDTIRTPEDRASYLVENFWELLDFDTDPRAADEVFMEQNFVNELSVINIARKDSRAKAIENLIAKAAGTPAEPLVLKLAEKYLFVSDSPFASDELYEMFLDGVLASPKIDDVRKSKYKTHRAIVGLNRPGNGITDFAFEIPDGKKTSLYKIRENRQVPALLLFYDPECGHCMEVIESIKTEPTVSQAVEKNELDVLAIFSGDESEKDAWKKQLKTMPKEWTVGFEPGTIQDEDLYVFRSMPTLFLIGADNKVIYKEIKPDKLLDCLKSITK